MERRQNDIEQKFSNFEGNPEPNDLLLRVDDVTYEHYHAEAKRKLGPFEPAPYIPPLSIEERISKEGDNLGGAAF